MANPEESLLGTVAYALLVGCSLVAVVSLFVRYRRSSGVERSQIKWVAFSLGVFVVGSVLIDVIWIDILGRSELSGPFFTVTDQLGWLLIPGSIAVAILRYRLYDIDRIISRTLSYVLVVGLLGAGVLGLVSLLAPFVPNDDPLVVAIATLVVAVLFNPLRKRVQRVVDQRFNRTRFDTERVVHGFGSELQNRLDPNGVLDGWVSVVSETMQPASLAVWVKRSSGESRPASKA